MKFYIPLLLLIVFMNGSIVLATHEVDHRFTVYGYVRDAQGHPVADARVMVVEKKGEGGKTAFTDSDGYYEALLHIHNDQLGDELLVTVSENTRQINETKRMAIQFDSQDRVTERRSRLDFGPEGRGKSGFAMYAAAALLVVGGITFWKMARKRSKTQVRTAKNRQKRRGERR